MKRKRTLWLLAGGLLIGGGGAATVLQARTSAAVTAQLGTWQEQIKALGGRVEVRASESSPLGGRQVTDLVFEDVTVTLTSTYRNGPWLPGARFGASLVTTNVTFSPTIQRVLDEATNGRRVTLETVVSFGGRTTTILDVPAARFSDEDFALAWTPLSATIRTSGKRAASTWRLEELSLGDEEVSVSLRGFGGASDSFVAPDGLTLGTSEAKLGTVEVGAEGETVSLHDLAVRSQTTAESGKLDARISTEVASLDFFGLGVRDARFAWSLRSLDRRALASLARLADKLGGEFGRLGGLAALEELEDLEDLDELGALDDLSEADVRALLSAFSRLLRGGPVVALDEISFATDDGRLRLSASATVRGGPDLDLARLESDPEALLSELRPEARLDFEADEPLLRTLETGLEMPFVDMAVESGFVVREAGRVRGKVELDASGVRVNGEPLR